MNFERQLQQHLLNYNRILHKNTGLMLKDDLNKIFVKYYEKIKAYYVDFKNFRKLKGRKNSPPLESYNVELKEIIDDMLNKHLDFLIIEKAFSNSNNIGANKYFKRLIELKNLVTQLIYIVERKDNVDKSFFHQQIKLHITKILTLIKEVETYLNFIKEPTNDAIPLFDDAAIDLAYREGNKKRELILKKVEKIRDASNIPQDMLAPPNLVSAVLKKDLRRLMRENATPSIPLPPPYLQSFPPTIQAAPSAPAAYPQSLAPTIQATPSAPSAYPRAVSRLSRKSPIPPIWVDPQPPPLRIYDDLNAPLYPSIPRPPSASKRPVIVPSVIRNPSAKKETFNAVRNFADMDPYHSPPSSKSPKSPTVPALTARSGSHSFKSNSHRYDNKPEFEIEGDVKTPPDVYLIDNKDDGLCFLNAIFDYLLYSDKLSIMYERLSAIEKLILKQPKYKDREDIKEIKKTALSLLSLLYVAEGTYERLIPISIESVDNYKKRSETGQLILLKGDKMLKFIDNKNKIEHLGHPFGKDRFGNDKKPYYENQRLIFALSMKYIVALYILSYGKNKFTYMITYAIKHTLFVEVEGEADPYRNEWNQNLLDYYHDRYEIKYDTNGEPEIYRKRGDAVATPDDIAEFVYQYVNEYMKNNNFFANQTLTVMFQKILFKKIKNAKGENIPRFWLEIATARTEYQDLRATNIFERVLNKYRFKTLPDGKYIHKDDKYDNYISLLCDTIRTHYLLFLLKREFKYAVVDNPTGGGKPKRPKTKTKTAAKSKRTKTTK
jgi:hypothetical protein